MTKPPYIPIRDLSDNLAVSSHDFIDIPKIAVPFTTIVNRAPMADITKDLKVSYGVERIMCRQLIEMQNEYSLDGQSVFALADDPYGMFRFAGNWFFTLDSPHGMFLENRGGFTDTTSYAEITFYGTGLNVLLSYGQNNNSYTYQLDGGSLVTLPPFAMLSTITTRHTQINQVFSIVSGLPLGLHTLKLNKVNGNELTICGFEILNETVSSLHVNPGTAYIAGEKYTVPAVVTPSYNSGFTNSSGTPGTKGGRVLVYLDSDGSVKKDVQYVDQTQHNTSLADHTNEEVVRIHNWREFGIGDLDNDFMLTFTGTATSPAFTLDDNSTNLYGGTLATNGSIFVSPATATNSFLAFTFIGTGLDFIRQDQNSAAIDPHDYYIDGVLIGTATGGSNIPHLQKIVSGLPYGQHVFMIVRNNNASNGVGVIKFIVYGPKTPSLPTGAFLLGTYNLMANFVLQTGSTTKDISQGVIRKGASRELVYGGTGWTLSNDQFATNGLTADNTTNGDTVASFKFFGTGVLVRAFANPTASVTITIDGVLYTGSASVVTGGASSWTPGTSTWAVVAGNFAEVLSIQGLSLGVHDIIVTVTSGAFRFQAFDIVTPIYSPVSPKYAVFQNSAMIGNNSFSDERSLSPALLEPISTSRTAQTVIIMGYVLTSTGFAYVPSQITTIFIAKKTRAKVTFTIGYHVNAAGTDVDFAVFLDGYQIPVGNSDIITTSTGVNYSVSLGHTDIIAVSPGSHQVQVHVGVNGSGSVNVIAAKLVVEQVD